MAIFLTRLDAAPVSNSQLSFELNSWLSVIASILNEDIRLIESDFNNFVVQSFTQAEIVAASSTAPDGSLWYCTDHVPPVYVGMISGALVQFTTTPFP